MITKTILDKNLAVLNYIAIKKVKNKDICLVPVYNELFNFIYFSNTR